MEEIRNEMLEALKNMHDDGKVLLWNLYQDTIEGDQKIYKVNTSNLMSMHYWESTITDDLYKENSNGKKELDLTWLVERYASLFIGPYGEAMGTVAVSKWMILEENSYCVIQANPLFGNEDDEYLDSLEKNEKDKVRYIDDVIDYDQLCNAILAEKINLSDVYLNPEIDNTDPMNQEEVNLDDIPILEKLLYEYEENTDNSESENI